MNVVIKQEYELTYCAVAATFDYAEELSEFDHFWPIVINGLNYFLHLLPVINKAQCNEWILQLINTDGSRPIVIQRPKVVPQLPEFFILKVNAMLFASRLQPIPQPRLRIELKHSNEKLC